MPVSGIVEQFTRFADLLSDALILVNRRGDIRSANAGARSLLGPALPPHARLRDYVAEPESRLLEYLKLCARSGQRLPGTLTFLVNGMRRVYHSEGSTARGERDDDGAALLVLRLVPKEDSVQRFALLNQRIEQLQREIRKRLAAERSADEQRELLHVTLASIGDAVITTDAEGRVSFMNSMAERATGWRAEDSRGKPLEDVFVIRNEQTGEPVDSPVLKVLRLGIVVGLANHTVLLRKDGERIPIDDSGAPIRDADGNLLGVVLVFHEISERRKLERELQRQADALREADRRKDEFLAMLGHELRNPLAPLHNAVELLRLQGSGADIERLAGMMQRQTAQLTRLVDDLLDIARITRGSIHLERRPVPLAQVLEHAVETTKPFIDERGHSLSVDLPPATLIVEGDLARLSQVFCNLLNNAAKFMDPGGEIALTAFERDGQAVTVVRDQGRGMEPEFLDRVFELFSHADRSLDRREGGLGIGLTLVKSLVGMHGGDVAAWSAGLGEGSEFTVTLPLISEAGQDEAAGEGSGQAPVSLRVLIVDDNVDAADSLAMLLGNLGCETLTVHDGPAALERALAASPDLVLLDIGLPGMDGFEVARELRRIPGLEQARIVAVTGYGSEPDRQRSREAGFDGHLTKPVGLEDLRELLR